MHAAIFFVLHLVLGMLVTLTVITILWRLFGKFWCAVIMSSAYALMSIFMGLSGDHGSQAVCILWAVMWGYDAWKNRHKRKKRPLLQKLGYKARALLARLVAGMPKARPRFNPAISGGRA